MSDHLIDTHLYNQSLMFEEKVERKVLFELSRHAMEDMRTNIGVRRHLEDKARQFEREGWRTRTEDNVITGTICLVGERYVRVPIPINLPKPTAVEAPKKHNPKLLLLEV